MRYRTARLLGLELVIHSRVQSLTVNNVQHVTQESKRVSPVKTVFTPLALHNACEHDRSQILTAKTVSIGRHQESASVGCVSMVTRAATAGNPRRPSAAL